MLIFRQLVKAIPACIIDSVYRPVGLLQPGPADPGRSVPAMAGGEERAGGLEGWRADLEERGQGRQTDPPASLVTLELEPGGGRGVLASLHGMWLFGDYNEIKDNKDKVNLHSHIT